MGNEVIDWFGRLEGPLHFRFLLQPAIAIILAARDGTRDAASGAPPFFWNVTRSSKEARRALIRDGWASIGKVFILAIVLDCVFQYLVSGRIAFIGSFVIASILAIVPYLIFRGAINRWKSHQTS